MPLVSAREIMLPAQRGRYAVGAFNIENMEMAQAVLEAAAELKAPVILQTTPSTLRYADMDQYFAIVQSLAKNSPVPAALHLDHGNSFEICVKALRAGYTSIMIDGSHSSFEENIAITKKVAEICLPLNIPVEAELGKVGGKEDDLFSDGPGYTDPDEAAEFVNQTKVFSLAIGIGTSHGVYPGPPILDKERVSVIAGKIPTPLVMHGTSGVPDEDVRECVQRGICKVNYATELRIAFSDGVKSYLRAKPDAFDPKEYLGEARRRVMEVARLRIRVCGSEGKGYM